MHEILELESLMAKKGKGQFAATILYATERQLGGREKNHLEKTNVPWRWRAPVAVADREMLMSVTEEKEKRDDQVSNKRNFREPGPLEQKKTHPF